MGGSVSLNNTRFFLLQTYATTRNITRMLTSHCIFLLIPGEEAGLSLGICLFRDNS